MSVVYPMPTDTVHVSIESRQYNLFNIDLGEGIARRRMLVGAIIGIAWFSVMALCGVSLLAAPWAYIVPVALGIVFSTREDTGGRPAYASWVDRLRYLIRRRRPVIPPVADPDRFLVAGWWAGMFGPITNQPFEVGASFLIIDPSTVKGIAP